MARSGWGIASAGALVAATLPVVVVTGAQAGVSGVDRGASSPEAAVAVARVQPRLVSAPDSQWAILATTTVAGNAMQPAILKANSATYADDSVFIPYDSQTAAGAYLSPVLTIPQVVPYSRSDLELSGAPSAAQGDDTVWMTMNEEGRNAEIASINRQKTVAAYPIRIANLSPSSGGQLRDLVGLVVTDDTIYAGFQTSNACSDVQAGIIRLSTRNPQDDSTVFTGVSALETQPGQLAKTATDDTLILPIYNCGGSNTPPKQILVASPKTNSTSTRAMPWHSRGAAAGDDTIYVSQSGGNGLAAINPRNIDDSRIVAVPGAGSFGVISVWQDPSNISDDTVFLPATSSNALWMVNGRTLVVDDSVSLPSPPSAISTARSNLVYASGGTTVWAVGAVSGRTVPVSSGSPIIGVPDDSITIQMNVPDLFTIRNSMVTNVYLDDTPVSAFAITDDTALQARVPNLTGGPYSVIVGLNGGNRIKVGEFTYRGSNPPTPPAPPVQAMTPTAQVINGIVGTAISPTSRFTLENFTLIPRYSVYPALPNGLSIDPVTGVVSGTPTVAYPSTRHWITASAGGNSESASSTLQVTISPAPTPPPPPPVTRSLVLNQGERTKGKGSIHDRITTTGSSTGIEPGTRLTPYIRYSGQSTFAKGRATIVVQADGTFRWTREIRRNRDVTGYVAFEDLKSNQVTWVKLQ